MTTLLISPSLGQFTFDAVFSIGHGASVTVTSHPVQTGASISDHAYVNPDTVSLSIGMSDCMTSTGTASRSVNAYATLRELMEALEPITLITRLKQYEDMMITSISVTDDASTMYALKANIELQHIEIVTTAVVTIQQKTTASKKSSKSGSTKETEVAETGDTETNESVANNLFSGFFSKVSSALSTKTATGAKSGTTVGSYASYAVD